MINSTITTGHSRNTNRLNMRTRKVGCGRRGVGPRRRDRPVWVDRLRPLRQAPACSARRARRRLVCAGRGRLYRCPRIQPRPAGGLRRWPRSPLAIPRGTHRSLNLSFSEQTDCPIEGFDCDPYDLGRSLIVCRAPTRFIRGDDRVPDAFLGRAHHNTPDFIHARMLSRWLARSAAIASAMASVCVATSASCRRFQIHEPSVRVRSCRCHW